MDTNTHQRLLDFLKLSFDPDGSLHFLAVAATETKRWDVAQTTLYKVRVAVTFQNQGVVDPYFDGTDLYVMITPSDIVFANEGDWAEGPPAMEGSPNQLALNWVSELAPPFWVSQAALDAAGKCQSDILD